MESVIQGSRPAASAELKLRLSPSQERGIGAGPHPPAEYRRRWLPRVRKKLCCPPAAHGRPRQTPPAHSSMSCRRRPFSCRRARFSRVLTRSPRHWPAHVVSIASQFKFKWPRSAAGKRLTQTEGLRAVCAHEKRSYCVLLGCVQADERRSAHRNEIRCSPAA